LFVQRFKVSLIGFLAANKKGEARMNFVHRDYYRAALAFLMKYPVPQRGTLASDLVAALTPPALLGYRCCVAGALLPIRQ
jgi:hypothetical protein